MKGVMKFLAIVAVALGCVSPAWADDVDGDAVDDAIDVCNNTPPGTAVDAEGRPLGDVDVDCDNDLDDYALSQQGFTGPLAPPGMVIDTVPVGDTGNAGELSGEGAGGFGPDRICGAVDYTYNIAKYEVTAGQYTEFLNAVANDDTYGLYDTSMWVNIYGCKIERTGSSPNYSYSVAPDWADRPVNYVSWGDAARFCNWLHNGQPTEQLTGDPAQDAGLTEDGSYHLNGATSDAALLPIVRKPDATWVIPSEDEWYKSAYYDGGSDVYYDYPTGSDSVPVSEACPGGSNSANYYGSNWAIGPPFYRNEVGCYVSSASPYATFDQGGNVSEWNEAILYGLSRGLRGGSFYGLDYHLHAALRSGNYPSYESSSVGFRVAEVP